MNFFAIKGKCSSKTVFNESQKLLKASSATVRQYNESKLILDKLFLNKFILFWEKSREENVLGEEVRFLVFRVEKVAKFDPSCLFKKN